MWSEMYTYTYILHNIDLLIRQKKFKKKKNWTAVNVACQGNLSVCHLGTHAMRFSSPVFSSVNSSTWPRTGVILAAGQFYDTMYFSIKLYMLIDTRLAQSS